MAFSTARIEAIACTVVQTPQMRWVKAQASRGSRPFRISSMPRNIVDGGPGVLHLPAVDLGLDAEMAFDAGDGIDDDVGHDRSPFFAAVCSRRSRRLGGSGGVPAVQRLAS